MKRTKYTVLANVNCYAVDELRVEAVDATQAETRAKQILDAADFKVVCSDKQLRIELDADCIETVLLQTAT